MRLVRGTLPAERIVMEHYRLGSTRAILSRSFCNTEKINDISDIEKIFFENMKKLREYEASMSTKTTQDYVDNKSNIDRCVKEIVSNIKEQKRK